MRGRTLISQTLTETCDLPRLHLRTCYQTHTETNLYPKHPSLSSTLSWTIELHPTLVTCFYFNFFFWCFLNFVFLLRICTTTETPTQYTHMNLPVTPPKPSRISFKSLWNNLWPPFVSRAMHYYLSIRVDRSRHCTFYLLHRVLNCLDWPKGSCTSCSQLTKEHQHVVFHSLSLSTRFLEQIKSPPWISFDKFSVLKDRNCLFNKGHVTTIQKSLPP